MSSPDEQRRQAKNGEVLDERPPQHQSGWEESKSSTLMVVAIVIMVLTCLLVTNIPGGYWQHDMDGHVAGDPIMRDKQPRRYLLLMTVCMTCFGSSFLMAVHLFIGVPVKSRRVRWLFGVVYSSFILTFIISQPSNSLAMDLILWVCVLLFLWIIISFKNWEESCPSDEL